PRARDRLGCDGTLDPPDELARLALLDLRDDHGELVASHAARDVGRTNDLPDALGDLREHGIAGEMADPVVDLLEAVDVYDHERKSALVPLGAVDLAREGLVEVAAIVEAGQRVEVRELPRLAEAARVLDRRRDPLRE